MTNDFLLFTGTANPELAMAIARELGVRLSACERCSSRNPGRLEIAS